MTTLMDPGDLWLYQRQYHDYDYMSYSDSRFQILEEGQVRIVLFAGYTFTCRLFGISVRTICSNLPVRAESRTKSHPLWAPWKSGGMRLFLLAESYSCGWLGDWGASQRSGCDDSRGICVRMPGADVYHVSCRTTWTHSATSARGFARLRLDVSKHAPIATSFDVSL